MIFGPPRTTLRYGDHPSQFAELYLPRTGTAPVPVVALIHGGFWRTRYGKSLGTPLARDLVRRHVAVLNIEYRRVGEDPRSGGGGWPRTQLDVAAALDLLAGEQVPAGRVDLSRIVAVGHSAGGQLAGWLAARPHFTDDLPGARPQVALSGFVSQAGVLDLEQAATDNLGDGAAQAMIGGSPDERADDYRAASPIRWPVSVPFVCVHGTADDVVPINQSERFLDAAAAAGPADEPIGSLVRLEGVGHRELIVPFHRGWRASRAATFELLGLTEE